MILTKIGARLAPLVIKAIPPLAKLWKKQDGKKTKIGIVELILGGVFLIVGGPIEVGVALLLDGVHQAINGLAHKADKKERGE